jgi:carbon monoxide dehydrogenase subunit G
MSVTRIESDTVEVNKPAKEIFAFLTDFNNFKSLMPPQVSEWESTADECSFNINGMAKIGMKIVEKTPDSHIKITSNGKVPFDFTLRINLAEKSEHSCSGQMVFEAELNPFLKMMVEKPLTNFFNLLTQKLKDINS